MSELFLKLLNMSISAGWLVLAVVVLRLLLKKAPKWIVVLLWGMVALRLICPFTIESALSLIPSAQTVNPEIMMDTSPEITTGIDSINNAVNPVISEAFAPEPTASANPLQIIIPVLANVWVLGIALMLLYSAVSFLRLRRSVYAAVKYRDNIFCSENVSTPFVLGILKPRIYLPFNMDPEDMELVICHEQAHIRRKDHWWKPLGFLLLSLHWFNPLMWLAYILLCRDIEFACDEKVIKELDNGQKADYTQALLACSIGRKKIAPCPLAFGEVGVKERVRSVMNYKKPAFWIIILAFIVCIVVAVCFLTDPVKGGMEFDPVTDADDVIATISAGENLTQIRTQNGEVVILQNNGGTWYFDEGQAVPVAITFANDGSSLSMKSVGYIYCGDGTEGLYAKEIFSDQTVNNSAGTFIAPESGNYLLYFRNYSASWLELKSFVVGYTFEAKVLQIHENYFLVEPSEDSNERKSSDRIEIPIQNFPPSPEPQVGDILSITYNGIILEIYPACLGQIYSIKVGQKEAWDLIPMVMVDGRLYLDTGYKIINIESSGDFDGMITTEVDASEQPTQNDQSNFGTGYGYRYGITTGTLQIYINGNWWLYATDEAKRDLYQSSAAKEGYILKGVSGENVTELNGEPDVVWSDGLVFEDLAPGEEVTSSFEIYVEKKSSILLSVGWSRTGLVMEYGIRAENGTSYFQEKTGGYSRLLIEDVPAGNYRLYIRNSDAYDGLPAYENPEKYDVSYDAAGVLLYSLESDHISQDPPKKFYLTIGDEGVTSIDVSMPGSSGGVQSADGSAFEKGEQIWLENLDGYTDLRGLTITAYDADGNVVWTASVPVTPGNEGFTRLTNNDWTITNVK